MYLTLKRVSYDLTATYGVLLDGYGVPIALTLEQPWRDNKALISCIPKGDYEVVKYDGTKFKNVFLLKNVPLRSAILIHAGNTVDDTQGCILVGNSFQEGKVLNSRQTLQKLFSMLPYSFRLTVRS